MTARRRRKVAVPTSERPPSILLRSPLALVGYVPDQFNKGPRSMATIIAARTIQAVARARWREVTGGGHVTWRVPVLMPGEPPIPAALRRAGEALADELLKR